jgi:hypothetical protein
MSLETYVALFALLISLVSTVISLWTLRAQINISKNSAFFAQKQNAESMFVDFPELLRLHNISDELLAEYDLTPQELVYIVQSLNAAEMFYKIDNIKNIQLSAYRKNFFNNSKVCAAWTHVIKGRLLSESEFTRAIDQYIEANNHPLY